MLRMCKAECNSALWSLCGCCTAAAAAAYVCVVYVQCASCGVACSVLRTWRAGLSAAVAGTRVCCVMLQVSQGRRAVCCHPTPGMLIAAGVPAAARHMDRAADALLLWTLWTLRIAAAVAAQQADRNLAPAVILSSSGVPACILAD